MSEERGKTGREFVIVPRKQLELPKPPTRKVARAIVREEREEITPEHEDFLKEDPGEAIEIGGYHFIRPEKEHYRHSRPTWSLEKGERGVYTSNNGVVAIYTNHGIFVGHPGAGFRNAAMLAGIRADYPFRPSCGFVPHSNWDDSSWLFERIDMHSGRLKPEFHYLFGRRYKRVRRERVEEIEEEIPAHEKSTSKPESIKLLLSEIKDDHEAFRFLHARIDEEIDHAFAATELHRPNPAVMAYVVKKLGISRVAKPEDVRKDVRKLMVRFHHDRFKPSGNFNDTHHRKVVNLLSSLFNFLKNVKT